MFADLLTLSIKKSGSVIVAGFDPRLDTIPSYILQNAAKESLNDEDLLYRALFSFHKLALETLTSKIAAIKPNTAFFEQYGIGGLRAFKDICLLAKDLSIPVIADAKRGDIGTTAAAYSAAYLGTTDIQGSTQRMFHCDALTVNPFLGFDTLDVFLKDCIDHGRGIFILVQTSNPGSKNIQGVQDSKSNQNVSTILANWIDKNSSKLLGTSGLSGLGAVVGATYPEEARALRKIMNNSIFLVPGYGAQGGKASDIVANFRGDGTGAVINISRALLNSFSSLSLSESEVRAEIATKIELFNKDINGAIKGGQR